MNDAIRAELQTSGRIASGVELKTYQTVDLNEAEKRDARFYQPGQFAYVIKRYGRLAKGDLCPIAGTNERGLVLIKDRGLALEMKLPGSPDRRALRERLPTWTRRAMAASERVRLHEAATQLNHRNATRPKISL